MQIVNSGEASRLGAYRQLDAERKLTSQLVAEVERLEKALEQAKLELRLERKNKFSTNKQKSKSDDCQSNGTTPTHETPAKTAGKLGAPVGHAGWYRKTLIFSL